MPIFISFLILYFTNLLLDYPLQSFLRVWKSKYWYFLYVHCAIWSIGVFIVCYFLGLGDYWKLAMLFIGHYVVDWWKCKGKYLSWDITDKQSLMIDQAFHTLQICLCLL